MTNRYTQFAMDIAAAKRKDPEAWERVTERQDTIGELYRQTEKEKAGGNYEAAKKTIQTRITREKELSAILHALNR